MVIKMPTVKYEMAYEVLSDRFSSDVTAMGVPGHQWPGRGDEGCFW